MEENENSPEVSDELQTEEVVQESGLSREEILAASRKENKSFDEREQQAMIKGNSLAMSAGLLIAGIIIIVSVFVKDVFPIEIIVVACGMQAVQSIFIGLSNRKLRKLYLTVGVIEAIAGVCLTVIWILQLCGVM